MIDSLKLKSSTFVSLSLHNALGLVVFNLNISRGRQIKTFLYLFNCLDVASSSFGDENLNK